LLACVGLLWSANLLFAAPDDGSIAECERTTISVYLGPVQTDPVLEEASGFVDNARLCNEEAESRMHTAFVALPLSLVAVAAFLALRRYPR
jgi:hypothetical protein